MSDANEVANTIARNLLRIRRARGLKQDAVARSAGLSRGAYVLIETGQSNPRADTLRALAKALGATLAECVTPVRELRSVRFRSQKRFRLRDQVLADVARKLRDYSFLEDLLNDTVDCALLSLPPDEPERLAASVREFLRIDKHDVIRDICGVLESAGVKVFELQIVSPGFFGLSVGAEEGGPAIVVNTHERIAVERWIFTAAHELGHLLLHRASYDVDGKEEPANEEGEADTFASYFLMPREVFGKEWKKCEGLPFVQRVLKIKRMFKVSYKTVLYRANHDVGLGSSIYPKFQVEYQRTYGKSLAGFCEPNPAGPSCFRAPEPASAGEPERLSKVDFSEDRLHSLTRRALDREEISLSRAAEILGCCLEDMRDLSTSWLDPLELAGCR